MKTNTLAGCLVGVCGLAVGTGASAGGPEGICSPLKLEHASGSPIAVGSMAGPPTIADMNRDGRPDVVIACGPVAGPERGHVIVLLNEGAGAFSRARRAEAGATVGRIAVTDMNGDGAPDVAVAEHDSYDVTVLVNDGSGTLAVAKAFPAAVGGHPHTHDIAAVDMNGDGHADLLTANADDNTISVLLGDGRGGFSPAPGSPFPTGNHPYALETGDFNGDGRMDAAVPFMLGGRLGVMIGDGRGGLRQGWTGEVAARPGFVTVGDMNGDGRADLIGTHDDVGIVDVLLGDGKGGFAPAKGWPKRFDPPVWGAAVADMNRDGRADLLLGCVRGRDIIVAMGGEKGTIARQDPYRSDTAPTHAAAGDLDGDNRLDIVTGNYEGGSVSVLLAR